ncbi:YceD family protein [Thauera sp. Sel9]|uniref:YceD family protein n=1 Tax=Thauera sp. Sel9 TaxID=2974299 RepID=UPI0021E187D4|nr:YceD family protein [Thauera sp. Sel9]MCV2216615.1 YceD family protein [Thauera sp. Sel9]
MSQRGASLGRIADPFRFAAEARTLSGEVEVAGLSRLADVLASDAGVVGWKIEGLLAERTLAEGGSSGRQEPRLRLVLEGRLDLRCQRCLAGFDWPLAVETVLQPVRAGQPIPDEELEDDAVDAIEVEDDLDVLALIEEEILLALPIAPRHEQCEAPRGVNGANEESPFAALASLRGSHRAD